MISLGSQAEECGTTTWSAYVTKFGASQLNKRVAHKAPAICATINNETSDGRSPAKVSDNERAIVTAGSAIEVDAVNLIAPAIPPAHWTSM